MRDETNTRANRYFNLSSFPDLLCVSVTVIEFCFQGAVNSLSPLTDDIKETFKDFVEILKESNRILYLFFFSVFILLYIFPRYISIFIARGLTSLIFIRV